LNTCPDCGVGIKPTQKRCPCGWVRPAPHRRHDDQPLTHLCCHEDRGQRCANPGSLTESTHGSERWYCHLHFPLFAGRGYGTARVVPSEAFKRVRDAMCGVPEDPETRAEREAIRLESVEAAARMAGDA
jgi:hypothetical protein